MIPNHVLKMATRSVREISGQQLDYAVLIALGYEVEVSGSDYRHDYKINFRSVLKNEEGTCTLGYTPLPSTDGNWTIKIMNDFMVSAQAVQDMVGNFKYFAAKARKWTLLGEGKTIEEAVSKALVLNILGDTVSVPVWLSPDDQLKEDLKWAQNMLRV